MDDKPPKYEEVVELYDVDNKDRNNCYPNSPSAPLLQTTDLESAISIKIVKEETKKRYGPFNFFIREAGTDLLVLEGQVGFKRTATINRRDGSPRIAITHIKCSNSNDEETKYFTHFEITRENASIGTVAIGPELRIVFVNELQNKPYLNKTDHKDSTGTEISISRIEGDKLVKIDIPKGKGYEPFGASVVFVTKSDQPVTTEDEKELLLAITVAFMVFRTGPLLTHREHKIWAGLGILFGMLILVGIIVGLVYLFKSLEENCNKPGYRCRGRNRY